MENVGQELIGKTISNRFRITSYIGEGAMAAVYCAEQDREPRHVALKIMHPDLTRDETFVRRFEREARAAARLDHPNTVRVVAHGADNGHVYLAMELLAGTDLFEVLLRENRFSEVDAADVVIQMARALEAAHAQGIVHRDLKPENVMLLPNEDDGSFTVKVLDFGIAKILEPELNDDGSPVSSGTALTRIGTLVGTPEYMSPEQCLGSEIDGRSDVYACGVILYQLLVGRPPFTGSVPAEILFKHTDEAPVPPSRHRPTLHPQLEEIVLTALAKDRDKRQQSARSLRSDLERVRPGLSTEIPTTSALPVLYPDERSADAGGVTDVRTMLSSFSADPHGASEARGGAGDKSVVSAIAEGSPPPKAYDSERPRRVTPSSIQLPVELAQTIPAGPPGPTVVVNPEARAPEPAGASASEALDDAAAATRAYQQLNEPHSALATNTLGSAFVLRNDEASRALRAAARRATAPAMTRAVGLPLAAYGWRWIVSQYWPWVVLLGAVGLALWAAHLLYAH